MCLVSLWSSLWFLPLFNFVLSPSVPPKLGVNFVMHKGMSALNSSGADAHDNEGNVFYCFVLLFSKREICRWASRAFNVFAFGPARGLFPACRRTCLLPVELKDQGVLHGAWCGAHVPARIRYCLLFIYIRGPLLGGGLGNMIHFMIISWPEFSTSRWKMMKLYPEFFSSFQLHSFVADSGANSVLTLAGSRSPLLVQAVKLVWLFVFRSVHRDLVWGLLILSSV